MKAAEMIANIARFMDSDKEVFAHIYTRDEDGNVTSKEVIPLSAVFAHEINNVQLCFEASQKTKENIA
jgi:hypothetical protein